MNETTPRIASNFYPYVYAGALLAVLLFGGLGGWALLAKLDSAVVAQGTVSLESNRKTVQHLEGGIVEQILVHEGQIVREGEVLLTLRPIQVEAGLVTQMNSLDGALALEARLSAEQDQSLVVVFPPELTVRSDRLSTLRAMNDQLTQFGERRASLAGQKGILNNRIEQLKRQGQGLTAVLTAGKAQYGSMVQEYEKVKPLADKGWFSANRFLEMQRRIDELRGKVGQTEADIAKNAEAVEETRLQILQTELRFREEVAQQLRDVRLQVGELREKSRVSKDVLARMEIRAPRGGMAQNLRVHTVGGVVKQGEAILEIVPLNDALIVQAHVMPLDVNQVHVGLDAEVRFPGLRSRTTPLIMGKVRTISADVLKDDTGKEPYYLAIVEVEPESLPAVLKGKLTAGMPADIMIATGERSVMDYLISPLANAVRKTMREN
jgi:HlyD family type I secretion membrane fusion protein